MIQPCRHLTIQIALITALILGIGGIPAGANAQEELVEIVVTAQKREQRLEDVGLAVSVFSGERIRELGFTQSVELAAMTPGVSRSGSSGEQTAQFSIRGVTQNDFSDHVEAPNAVYIDEGYVGSMQAQVFGLFDLERVEVLKGPQGTLFGRNATGGLVHFVSRKPTQEFNGFLDVTYGEYERVRIEGAVGGPLTDRISGRLSVFYNRHDELIDNIFPAGLPEGFSGSDFGHTDIWNDDQWAARGQILADINDRAELLVSVFSARQQPTVGNWQHLATTAILNQEGAQVDAIRAQNDPRGCMFLSQETGGCVGGTRPIQGGDFFGWQQTEIDDVSQDFAVKNFNEYATDGITANLAWDFDAFELTAISHFMRTTKRQTQDTDSGPQPQSIVMNDSDNNTFTQEVRFSGSSSNLNWVAGFYYLHIDVEYNQGLADVDDGLRLFGTAPGSPPLEHDFTADLQTNSFSVFGQVDVGLTDRLTLVLGLRGIQEEKDYDYTSFLFENTDPRRVDNDVEPVAPFLPAFSDSTSDTLWAAKAQLEFRPTTELLLYAGVNRGVKAGSFNAPLLAVLSPDQFGYKEEVLLAYEGGLKATIFDGRARINASAYYYDYEDYQAFLFQGISGAIFNNDANYKGGELELVTNPVPNLTFSFGASYVDAEIENLAVAPNVTRDVRPAFTPEWQLNALARYRIPQPVFGGFVSFQIDGNYSDSYFQNIQNFQSTRTESYAIGNIRLSWESESGRWTGTVFLENFSDRRHQTTAVELSGLCGCSEQSYNRPRWAGASVNFSF